MKWMLAMLLVALAPAPRVMLFLADDGFSSLSAQGMRLFDAAIDRADVG